MERSQSGRKFATETENSVDMRHALSQPVYLPRSAANNESNNAGTSSNVRSNSEDLRRRIVQLNKELDQERMVVKNLKRDKAIEVRQVRDEEQKRAASMQADLRSKLQKEKINELTSLKEQLHKEKEKDIVQIIKQKDENLRSAQLTWVKEKEELRSKIRSEIWSEARDEAKREFQRERTKLEQEISDVHRQKAVLEDTLKLVQGADKRKIDDIRRVHHEHEAELEKFKKNSWQESRRQMAEIRQLLNIIEQLEKKLGLEAGHSMRLRLEKDNLYDMLKKSTTFDAWDRMMSSSFQIDQGQTMAATTAGLKGSQELRMLQRKNVELSSLVRKLDEKNQQLATRNAELLAEIEKLEKETRDKRRKLERNNADLVQNNRRLETRNKMLLDEINMLKQKKILTGKKDNSVKPRGQTDKEHEELANLRAQLREQARDITDFKQSLMEKDRRIELLRGRNKAGKKKTSNGSCQSADALSVPDDDVMSAHSDFSESSDDIDSRRVKKLAKELLALERAYALLQAHVGSVVDAERDEMERQQLQSDLLQSQARIHELERMINNTGQGGSEEISQLQQDNKALYQKLMLAEKERDQAQEKLSKHSEDLRDLQDQRDLLEFELEEMSQLSVADSGDWDFKRPRSSISADSLSIAERENECSALSLEEVKACLEELETEKENMLSPLEQNAVKRARELLDSMAEEITHMQITESALRDKVRDLDLGYNSESLKSELYGLRGSSVVTCNQETLTVLQWAELERMEATFRKHQLETSTNSREAGVGLQKENTASMTDLMLEDLENLENIYRSYYLEGLPLQGTPGKDTQFYMAKTDVECMTDLVWRDLTEMENMQGGRIEGLGRGDYNDQQGKVDSETMTNLALKELDDLGKLCPWCGEEKDFTPKDAKEVMAELFCEDFVKHASLNNDISTNSKEEVVKQKKQVEMGINTDLVWLELVELETKYHKYMDYMQNMESRFDVEKEYMTPLTKDVPVTEIKGSLPAIVQDTFLEDVRTRDACSMTDTAWNDVVDLQNKCTAYRRELETLQDKLSRFEVTKDEKSSTTNISLQDLATLESICEQMCKSNTEMKDAETLTDTVFCEEALPSFVLETHRGDIETKDECDMTEGIWDEVVDLQNTYRDYRQNLDVMKEKVAQFQVEKSDKESITDIAMQDLTDLENIYKEHLAENDLDGSCSVGQAEKESKGCMTEVTLVVMRELEDFYIDHAASAAVVEKLERDSMTEITSDDMLYLAEIEDLFRKNGPSFGAAVDKEEKSTETDLTTRDLDYLQDVDTAYLDSISRGKEERRSNHMDLRHDGKVVEKGIIMEVEASCKNIATARETQRNEEVPFVESVDKKDQGVVTDMTAADLKYLKDVEAAHEECLLDDELKARMCVEETSSIEVMTNLTIADITHLEDVEVAYKCLLDKEEEASKARPITQDKQTSGTMTDLTICDLQDQETDILRGGIDCKEKENVALMTELTLSDIQCLEDVKLAQEEWLLYREEDSSNRVDKEKDRVDVFDLKHLRDGGIAYEEGLLDMDGPEGCTFRMIAADRQSVEIMTDLSLSDLEYLEDVEAAHEECLLDKGEEEAKAAIIDLKGQSADTMTNLTMDDVKYLEDVEALYNEEVEWKANQVEGQNQDVGTMTDFTASHLPDQELAVATNERKELSKWIGRSESSPLSFHQENKSTMTEITGNVLDSFCVVTEPERENKEAMTNTVEKSNTETITHLTLHVEEEFGRLQQKQVKQEDFCKVVTEPVKEDKGVMTELTNSELQYLEEAEMLFSERANNKVDADAMTDLTTADLEYLEEAENVLKMLQSDGNIPKLVVPTEDKEVITNIRSSDVEYLQLLLEKDAPALDYQIGNIVEQDDKCTETEMTVTDIRDLEDQAYTAAELGPTPQFKEVVNEDFQVETMVDLRSELEHLPVFDEPEFMFDQDVEEDIIEREDVGIMTELRAVDLEHLESLTRRNQTYRADSDSLLRPDTNDTGVQCELTVVSMMEELTRETEQNGGQLPSWFVSALKMGSPVKGNFDPVHLLIRQGDFDQVDNHVETDLVSENVAEESPLFDISDDDSHEREYLPLNSTWDVVSHPPNADKLGGEIVALSQDVGVQCDLADLLSMFEDYHRDPSEEEMPSWFVSAVRMTRDSSGFDPVQVVLRNRSEDDVVENPVIRRHSSNLSIELSRPLLRSSAVSVNFPPSDSLENDQFEYAEADASLFTPLNASDNVFPESDRSLDPPTDGEERDVILDMTPNSAVKRFDRFLKERKDSELKNLMALQDLDESFGEAKISIVMQEENQALKEHIKHLEDETTLKELEEENELLKQEIEVLRDAVNMNDLQEENALLKERIHEFEEKNNARELEMENQMLKEELHILEESPGTKELEKENALLKGKVESVNVLEEENEVLKENVQILEETATEQRLENEYLKEKIQDLEESTARRIDELKEENTLLKEKIRDLEISSDRQELEQENVALEEKIRTLESSAVGSSSEDEFELLQLKIEQLKEAEKKIGALNEANMTLREKIELLLSQKKSVRDNSSEMDPTEKPGRADKGIQTLQGLLPPLVNQEIQTVASIFTEVNQEVQTDEDALISARISKELQKLKEENSELCEEVVELRMEAMDRERQVANRVLLMPADEARQTEHAQLEEQTSDEVTTQVYSSPCRVPSCIEETITPVVRSTVASKISDLHERLSHLPAVASVPVGPASVEEDLDKVDVLDPHSGKDELKKMPSVREGVCHVDGVLTPEPDITLVATLDYLIENEDHGSNQTDVDGLLDVDLDDSEALPPLPDCSPPPLPCAPPPDFLESSPPVLDHGIEVLLMSESSPPRDAATLRASSRKQSRSSDKPSANTSRASSPVESAEAAVTLETEPSKCGALPNNQPFSRLADKRDSSVESRPRVPPPTLPKPQRPTMFLRKQGQLSQPFTSLVSPNMASSLPSQWSRDKEDGVNPPRGIVRARASLLNRGEIDALNEKIVILEKQLKNKESVIRSMKTEATQLETQSLLERKSHEMKILEDDIAFLKQENQKKERELLTKIGEMNKKSYEIEQWKAEANNSERQRQRMEAAYLNLQNQLKSFQGADRKLAELQSKHSGMEKQNWELSEKVKKLEKTDSEFKKLEHNIQVLQTQVQEMDILEQERNKLLEKIKLVENQRDDLLRKGKLVESERNDFLRNNKLMEMQREELENRCALLLKTNSSLNGRLEELDQDLKQAQTRMHDSRHERNYLQVQLDKVEAERNEFQERLAVVTQERNSLENQVAELQDLNRDHVKLEDGFHTLRIKLAELTREKDDAEMQIPTLKAKVSLLKRACKEKDELADKLNEEIRELRHSIATSALDDLSKIRTYGYSPENFVKLSAQRDHELQRAKRASEDLIEARLKSKLEKSPPDRKSKPFGTSPPGTKEAKRFVALFDYNPYKSPSSEHPELEVNLREGQYLTVFGDMDINGYFEADVNGVRGLVPSLYVEELEDDTGSDLGLEEHKVHTGTSNNVSPYKGSEHPVYSDSSAASVVSSSAELEPRQLLLALDDYDPDQSATTGHLAYKQVSLKKGDVMTAVGDMDANGFYWVQLNGQTGFVPGHLVDELSSSTFLQPSNSTAPEQILRMLDNIPFCDQPQASADLFTPVPVSSTSYPTHALGDVTSSSHVHYPIRPIPPVGLTRFKPAPEVATLGPLSQYSQTTALAPNSTHPTVATQTVSLSRLQNPGTTSFQPAASTQIVPVSKKNQSSRKARPSPPEYFRILRPVNHDAMLVGWTLPELDEYGRSKGLVVKGYKIYANNDVKLDVRSAFMAKALIEDLDLRFPIKFSIKTVAENGILSEAVSARFSDTIDGDMLNSSGDTFEVFSKDFGDEQQYRTFVALYDYDAFKSSPNPNPACEMSFKEGDILRVFDTSRKDGFYLGKLKNKKGLIPSNFVEEVAVASPRRLAAAMKQHDAARSSPIRPFSRSSSSSGGATLSAPEAEQPAPISSKLMVAQYDYNPEKQSPQENIDSELPFKKGQVITVIGEMHGNGFYQADIDGRLGLVPGSFLDDYTNTDLDNGLNSEHRVSFNNRRSQRRLEELYGT